MISSRPRTALVVIAPLLALAPLACSDDVAEGPGAGDPSDQPDARATVLGDGGTAKADGSVVDGAGGGGGDAEAGRPENRYAFVTVEVLAGGAGTASLDEACTKAAAAAVAGGKAALGDRTYRAFVQEGDRSPEQRVGADAFAGVYLDSSGSPIGTAENLRKGEFPNVTGLGRAADGTIVGTGSGWAVYAWTGGPTASCNGWTTGDPGIKGAVGLVGIRESSWQAADMMPCDQSHHVYCFEAP